MKRRENELEKLEKLAESFSTMGDFTQVLKDSYSRLESRFENVNSRLARVNELLRNSLCERNKLAHYLSNILESVDSGVIVTDQSGAINVFNAAAERYTGLESRDVIGVQYGDIIKIDPQSIADASRLAGGESLSGEVKLIRSDLHEIPTAYSITRLRQEDEAGRSGLVVILYDLTEIRRLEENLKRISTLAALGEMAATVAHEIRNPLAGISGFTALLLRDLDPDSEAHRLVEKINLGVRSLNSIVVSLLDYTRNVTPELQFVDPIKVIEDAVGDLEADTESKNYRIEIVAGKRSIRANLDPQLFRMILFNLLKNAVQASPAGGKVIISLKKSPSGHILVSVQDNGPGISDEALGRLFVPFFTTKVNGTGLGLATVKKLTELQGGKIDVRNSPAGGAIFTVEIPGAVSGETIEA